MENLKYKQTCIFIIAICFCALSACNFFNNNGTEPKTKLQKKNVAKETEVLGNEECPGVVYSKKAISIYILDEKRRDELINKLQTGIDLIISEIIFDFVPKTHGAPESEQSRIRIYGNCEYETSQPNCSVVYIGYPKDSVSGIKKGDKIKIYNINQVYGMLGGEPGVTSTKVGRKQTGELLFANVLTVTDKKDLSDYYNYVPEVKSEQTNFEICAKWTKTFKFQQKEYFDELISPVWSKHNFNLNYLK